MSEEQTEYKVIDRRTLPEKAERLDFLGVIERLSSNPNIGFEKIEQLIKMQQDVLDRDAKRAFNAAMTAAQKRIETVVAKTPNTQTGSKYSKLSDVLAGVKPIYTEEGFSLMFYEGDTPKPNHKRIMVDIMHNQGHTETRFGDFAIQTSGIKGTAMMTEIHGEGSCFSYGRRYLTCAIFNIPTGDDDDGNDAGSEFITQEQASDINKMILETNADIKKVLEVAQSETVDTIPAKKYTLIMGQLKERKTKLTAKQKPPPREPGQEG